MNYEFEDQVLGMVIYQHQRYWPQVKHMWKPELFGSNERIKIASAIKALSDEEVDFNISTLKAKLNGCSSILLIDRLGLFIREVNIDYFINQIVSWYNLKNLVLELSSLAQEILTSKQTDRPERIISKFKNLHDIAEECVKLKYTEKNMKDILESTVKKLEDRILIRKNGQIRGYSMGLNILDDIMQGFIPGRFYIIAARTSVGKTSFASFVTLKAIKQNSKPVFFSNEMDKEDLVEKFIAHESKISTQKFQTGDLTESELSKLVHSVNDLSKYNLIVDEKNGWDLDTLLSTVHHLHRRNQCDLVVVDYLQQVRVKSAKSKYEQVSIVSDEMKRLSRELNIPVIGLAQINREAEKIMTKEIPGLANLKDSGSLEQDADVVMILHKEKLTDEMVNLNVAKNRYGPTGLLKMRHIHKYNTYESV